MSRAQLIPSPTSNLYYLLSRPSYNGRLGTSLVSIIREIGRTRMIDGSAYRQLGAACANQVRDLSIPPSAIISRVDISLLGRATAQSLNCPYSVAGATGEFSTFPNQEGPVVVVDLSIGDGTRLRNLVERVQILGKPVEEVVVLYDDEQQSHYLNMTVADHLRTFYPFPITALYTPSRDDPF